MGLWLCRKVLEMHTEIFMGELTHNPDNPGEGAGG